MSSESSVTVRRICMMMHVEAGGITLEFAEKAIPECLLSFRGCYGQRMDCKCMA